MKIQKLKNNVSPFAGISFVNHSFIKSGLAQLIDTELGRRVKSIRSKNKGKYKNLFFYIIVNHCLSD